MEMFIVFVLALSLAANGLVLLVLAGLASKQQKLEQVVAVTTTNLRELIDCLISVLPTLRDMNVELGELGRFTKDMAERACARSH